MSAPRLRLALGLALVLLASTLLGGDCNPPNDDEVALYRLTNAPPTRTAEIREDDGRGSPARIDLSRGVVLAVGCWDTCDYTCEDPVLTVSDPSVLAVRTVDRLTAVRPDLALIAIQPGTTNLTVETECARKTYLVQVADD